jgi:hypothetical protein
MNIHEVFEARWRELGFDNLFPEEREYLALWWLAAEVSNGGLDQYFFNSTGDMAPLALVALESLGAVNTARTFREALAVFGEDGYTPERYVRQQRLLRVSPQCDAFDDIEKRLDDGQENVLDLAAARLRQIYQERGIAIVGGAAERRDAADKRRP